MFEFRANIVWERDSQIFSDNKFSRRHRWLFDGGAEVLASSSPHTLPEPMSDPAGIDPEEAFVAALASCHMLWFLAIAAARGYCVDSYSDNPVGVMGMMEDGRRKKITHVTLRPHATFGSESQPTHEEINGMHQKAHANCFISNSINSEVICTPI
jgi:organic hydroperoxide reductase OsmC/OhrA